MEKLLFKDPMILSNFPILHCFPSSPRPWAPCAMPRSLYLIYETLRGSFHTYEAHHFGVSSFTRAMLYIVGTRILGYGLMKIASYLHHTSWKSVGSYSESHQS